VTRLDKGDDFVWPGIINCDQFSGIPYSHSLKCHCNYGYTFSTETSKCQEYGTRSKDPSQYLKLRPFFTKDHLKLFACNSILEIIPWKPTLEIACPNLFATHYVENKISTHSTSRRNGLGINEQKCRYYKQADTVCCANYGK